jgi:hypothetical protein
MGTSATPTTPAPVPGGSTGQSIFNNAAPFISGALSVGGQLLQDKANRAEAERNREFQERMSSTAAQRSVEDYKRAGLNPALAYDRSASTPGGAQAQIGNAVSQGVSSAQGTKQLMNTLQIANAQSNADLDVKKAQAVALAESAGQSASQRELNRIQEGLGRQTFQFNASVNQPNTQRMNDVDYLLKNLGVKTGETDLELKRLGIPRARNEADAESIIKNGIHDAGSAAELLKLLIARQVRK